ncbi:hypothetical protein F4818DRAFT_445129 [Hypoxylon cercidicola]|nr:hypothetical protein F4818DRAFT_445129 [Hypoxylon cercidicola]
MAGKTNVFNSKKLADYLSRGAVPAVASETAKAINEAPTTTLDIFVIGHGAGGELDLSQRSPIDMMSPRSNELVSANDVGVAQVSCGGMHGIAATRDEPTLTWGVDGHGTLGRDTNVEVDDGDDLNSVESTPGQSTLQI